MGSVHEVIEAFRTCCDIVGSFLTRGVLVEKIHRS
jgi:hypothetical protein